MFEIEAVRLLNFKAFKDTGIVRLKPITILAGANSSGKTSILQSLLLLKQTLEEGTPSDLYLNGSYMRYSNFKEIVYLLPPLNKCSITFNILFYSDIPKRNAEEYIPDLPVTGYPEEKLPLKCDLQLTYRYKREKEGRSRVVLDSCKMTTSINDYTGPEISVNHSGYTFLRCDGCGIKMPKSISRKRIKESIGRYFMPSMLTEREEEKGGVHHPPIRIDPIFTVPTGELEDYLKDGIDYLGPLREEPQRIYLHTASPFNKVGNRGEYAAQILAIEKNRKTTYMPINANNPVETTLLAAVRQTLQDLGISQSIDVTSIESQIYKINFGLKENLEKQKVTIADVGFGLSQVLPIIVMGIRASEGNLLLFEQPEIHLHPRLQANIADFFISLAKSGKRLIIETHSDYLINRVRRRIAEDETGELEKFVNILFF